MPVKLGYPKALGPHGITLYKHALAGKMTGHRILQALGQADVPQPDNPLSKRCRSISAIMISAMDRMTCWKSEREHLPRLGIRRTGWSYGSWRI
jgi:hypothetical protein